MEVQCHAYHAIAGSENTEGTVHSHTPACYNSLVSQALEQPSQPSHKETYGTVEQRVHCLHWLFHAKICENIFSS